MKQKVRTYLQSDGTETIKLAGRLVSLMGFNDAISICIENQWDGIEGYIRRMRKDRMHH